MATSNCSKPLDQTIAPAIQAIAPEIQAISRSSWGHHPVAQQQSRLHSGRCKHRKIGITVSAENEADTLFFCGNILAWRSSDDHVARPIASPLLQPIRTCIHRWPEIPAIETNHGVSVTPPCSSSSISDWVNPASTRTSMESWPRRGACRRMPRCRPAKLTGLRTVRYLPSVG